MKGVPEAKATNDPSAVRESLLNAARQAGPRYISVRGIDLEMAITGKGQVEPIVPPQTESKPTTADK